jgi:hypothetical protein
MSRQINLAMPELSQLISEARARIIWGEESSSVRSFLVSNGISEIDADAKIKEFNAERNNEIRKRAIRQILIGSILLVGAAVFLYVCLKHPSPGLMLTSRYKGLAGVGLPDVMACGSW